MILADYHIHCLNSPDSNEQLENICKEGIRIGLNTLMITDHYELGTVVQDETVFHSTYLEECCAEIERCRAVYGNQIYIGFGIELGQCHLQQEKVKQILEVFEFDYIIGSLHKLNNKDLMFYQYNQMDGKKVRQAYLESLLEMTRVGEFDCMGHLDLIKRYAARQGVTLYIEEEEEIVREILGTLVTREKGLEINTSGLRQATQEMFPSKTLLKWYKELGGEIITVGSDAHRAEDVGAGFQKAENLLKEVGFKWISHFIKREMRQIEL